MTKVILIGTGTIYPIHAGALMRLAEEGCEFDEVVASSWSALIGAALGTGYSPNTELTKFIKKTLPAKHNLMKESYWTLTRKWGLVDQKKHNDFLKGFFAKNIDEMKIPTTFLAKDVRGGNIEYFSSKKNAGMAVGKALAASMAIPGFMPPVKLGQDMYCDATASLDNALAHIQGDDFIILRAEASSEVQTEIKNMKQYIFSMVSSWAGAASQAHIPSRLLPNTIRLHTTKPAFDLNLTDTDVDFMVAEGYKATGTWLKENGHV